MDADDKGPKMARRKNMLNLNAAEITVLKALVQGAEDCSGGDFAIMSEVKVPGMTRSALGGHVTALEQKGAISVHETFVNGSYKSKGTRVVQVLITDEAKAAVVPPPVVKGDDNLCSCGQPFRLCDGPFAHEANLKARDAKAAELVANPVNPAANEADNDRRLREVIFPNFEAPAAAPAVDSALDYYRRDLTRRLEEAEQEYVLAVDRMASESAQAAERFQERQDEVSKRGYVTSFRLNVASYASTIVEKAATVEALRRQLSDLRSAISLKA
jgi:hypothetical protein